MSLIRLIGHEVLSAYRSGLTANKSVCLRNFSISATQSCKEIEAADAEDLNEQEIVEEAKERNPKDRTKIIPVENSIKYLASQAYKHTYQGKAVWVQYRRNHKGHFPPSKTRKTCVRKGLISTGNPCPICRDEYLVLDHHNIDLLKQFISPQTGEVLSYKTTGLCQKKHLELLVAVERAMDRGMLTFDVPFREYDYSEYYQVKQ